MNDFLLSQVLVAIAIGFDLLSFQFKERQKIVACLFCAGVLISTHFALPERISSSNTKTSITLSHRCEFKVTS